MTALLLVMDSPQQYTGMVGKIPAIDLYTSELHKLVRAYHQVVPEARTVFISAKYGLIDSHTLIYPYTTGLSYERVDKWLSAFQKQWTNNKDRWLEGVDEMFVAATGAHLYVAQRLEIMIHQRRAMRRFMVGNVAPLHQLERWV